MSSSNYVLHLVLNSSNNCAMSSSNYCSIFSSNAIDLTTVLYLVLTIVLCLVLISESNYHTSLYYVMFSSN